MKEYKLSSFIKFVFETPDNSGSWFGYYNYDPLNYDQSKLLCQRTNNDAQIIQKGMIVEVGYYLLSDGTWHPISTSDSYNWPQGCMAQWLPGENNNNKIIFNTSKGEHIISKIVNIDSGEISEIDWPIYGLTPDGKFSISLDFERIYHTIAYHYQSVQNPKLNENIVEGDGVFSIDLTQNIRKLIISIEDIIKIDPEPCFTSCKHWVEHIMVSPGGKRFCFLHRFSPDNNDKVRITRLFIADINGENLQLIPGWRTLSWSHFGWCGDDSFSIYTYESQVDINNLNANLVVDSSQTKKNHTKFDIRRFCPSFLKEVLKQILYGHRSYYQYYSLQGDEFVLSDSFKNSSFDIDGHQNFTTDKQYMIADTYPDEKSWQKLLVFNKTNGKILRLAKFYAGLNHKPGTCDLHPKLCKNNKYLMVDSAYNGRHHLILFELKWSKIKNILK